MEGGDWAEIDRLNEEELAAAEAALLGEAGAAGASRIAAEVQQLSLGGEEDGSGSGSEGEESEEDDDGEWETAAKSGNAARRAKRRAARKAAWEARQAAAAAEAAAGGEQQHAEAGAEEQEGESEEDDDDDACSLASDDDATATRAEPAAAADEGAAQQAGSGGGEGGGGEGEQPFESSVCIITADFAMQNVIMQVGDRVACPVGGLVGGLHLAVVGVLMPHLSLAVPCSATDHFRRGYSHVCDWHHTAPWSEPHPPDPCPPPPQMGLRLLTPDGRRITRLSRWVLRCTACFLVTKEMGRLFCPRCGNASLDKVQVRPWWGWADAMGQQPASSQQAAVGGGR